MDQQCVSCVSLCYRLWSISGGKAAVHAGATPRPRHPQPALRPEMPNSAGNSCVWAGLWRWLPVAVVRVLPRLRGLPSLRALRLRSGVLAVRGCARFVPAPLPVRLLVVAAFAVVRLRGGLLLPAPLALVSLRLGLTRRRVKRRSGLETGDGPLLDTLVDQALDRGQQRPVFAAHQRHRLAR